MKYNYVAQVPTINFIEILISRSPPAAQRPKSPMKSKPTPVAAAPTRRVVNENRVRIKICVHCMMDVALTNYFKQCNLDFLNTRYKGKGQSSILRTFSYRYLELSLLLPFRNTLPI